MTFAILKLTWLLGKTLAVVKDWFGINNSNKKAKLWDSWWWRRWCTMLHCHHTTIHTHSHVHTHMHTRTHSTHAHAHAHTHRQFHTHTHALTHTPTSCSPSRWSRSEIPETATKEEKDDKRWKKKLFRTRKYVDRRLHSMKLHPLGIKVLQVFGNGKLQNCDDEQWTFIKSTWSKNAKRSLVENVEYYLWFLST